MDTHLYKLGTLPDVRRCIRQQKFSIESLWVQQQIAMESSYVRHSTCPSTLRRMGIYGRLPTYHAWPHTNVYSLLVALTKGGGARRCVLIGTRKHGRSKLNVAISLLPRYTIAMFSFIREYIKFISCVIQRRCKFLSFIVS